MSFSYLLLISLTCKITSVSGLSISLKNNRRASITAIIFKPSWYGFKKVNNLFHLHRLLSDLDGSPCVIGGWIIGRESRSGKHKAVCISVGTRASRSELEPSTKQAVSANFVRTNKLAESDNGSNFTSPAIVEPGASQGNWRKAPAYKHTLKRNQCYLWRERGREGETHTERKKDSLEMHHLEVHWFGRRKHLCHLLNALASSTRCTA